MDRKTPLDKEVMVKLGFSYNKGVWVYSNDERFSIRIVRAFFFVSFFGYESGFPHPATVGDLEKLYFDRAGKLLF